MSYRDPDACDAIERIRERNPTTPQRELARQIRSLDFSDFNDENDSCDVSINDSFASVYARVRRCDAKRAKVA